MMIFINAVYKETVFPRWMAKEFIKLLNPICPFITEELWLNVFGEKESIAHTNWPTYDEAKTKADTYTLVVQVNGKLRDRIDVSASLSNEEIQKIALESEKVKAFTNGLTIVKVLLFLKNLLIS